MFMSRPYERRRHWINGAACVGTVQLSSQNDNDYRSVCGGRSHGRHCPPGSQSHDGYARAADDHRERARRWGDYRIDPCCTGRPDGYTIEMGHMGTHAASVALFPNLGYKPDVDFEPIGMAAGTPVVILAKKGFPPKDLKEFVPYVKANVEKLNMAHAGVGSVSFTTCLLLNHIMKVKPVQVPYNGTGPAMNALVAGQVDYMCDQIVNVVPQIQGGTIKGYAVGTPERNPALP